MNGQKSRCLSWLLDFANDMAHRLAVKLHSWKTPFLPVVSFARSYSPSERHQIDIFWPLAAGRLSERTPFSNAVWPTSNGILTVYFYYFYYCILTVLLLFFWCRSTGPPNRQRLSNALMYSPNSVCNCINLANFMQLNQLTTITHADLEG